ncbi:mucin-19 [Hyla sarda]|uniref:mucin-19 n=1 Tax=Hyla sarda TaxID=327740 RepID=UPI0024C2C26A|nr:mucin-19 [Hyla sarda]
MQEEDITHYMTSQLVNKNMTFKMRGQGDIKAQVDAGGGHATQYDFQNNLQQGYDYPNEVQGGYEDQYNAQVDENGAEFDLQIGQEGNDINTEAQVDAGGGYNTLYDFPTGQQEYDIQNEGTGGYKGQYNAQIDENGGEFYLQIGQEGYDNTNEAQVDAGGGHATQYDFQTNLQQGYDYPNEVQGGYEDQYNAQVDENGAEFDLQIGPEGYDINTEAQVDAGGGYNTLYDFPTGQQEYDIQNEGTGGYKGQYNAQIDENGGEFYLQIGQEGYDNTNEAQVDAGGGHATQYDFQNNLQQGYDYPNEVQGGYEDQYNAQVDENGAEFDLQIGQEGNDINTEAQVDAGGGYNTLYDFPTGQQEYDIQNEGTGGYKGQYNAQIDENGGEFYLQIGQEGYDNTNKAQVDAGGGHATQYDFQNNLQQGYDYPNEVQGGYEDQYNAQVDENGAEFDLQIGQEGNDINTEAQVDAGGGYNTLYDFPTGQQEYDIQNEGTGGYKGQYNAQIDENGGEFYLQIGQEGYDNTNEAQVDAGGGHATQYDFQTNLQQGYDYPNEVQGGYGGQYNAQVDENGAEFDLQIGQVGYNINTEAQVDAGEQYGTQYDQTHLQQVYDINTEAQGGYGGQNEIQVGLDSGYGSQDQGYENPDGGYDSSYLQAPTKSQPEETEMSGSCGTWGKGAYKTLHGQVFYVKSSSIVALCYHCVEEAQEFNVQAKRYSDGSLENIHVKLDSSEIEVSTGGIQVNSQPVTIPYMNKNFRIHKCGMYTKITSNRNVITVTFNLDLGVDINLEKSYKTCGLCGDSNFISDDGWEAFFEKNIIEFEGETKVPLNPPPYEATVYCAGVMRRNFLSLEPDDLDKYIKICAYEYSECEDSDKRSCACPTFTEVAFLCGNSGCSDSLSAWRTDENVVCEIPVCPDTQSFDECAPISQPTCSNPTPSQDVGVVAGCTCPDGLVLNDVPSGTYNQCVNINECPCSYGGLFYQPGSSRESTCNSLCQCLGGEWKCSEEKCPGTCKIEEGLYVTTFDGKKYNLYGNCEYIISHDETWLISGEIIQTVNAQSTSSLNSITLVLNRGKVENKFVIRKDGVISNSDIKDQNHHKSDQMNIIRIDDHLNIKMKNGLEMLLQLKPTMQLYISVPNTGFENTRGLCGSYNNKGDDDFMSNQNILESLPEAFFRSWTIASCPKLDPPTCISLDNEMFAQEHCSQLKDPNGPFATCHFDVDYRIYYERCVSLTCISEDVEAGLCTALANYALACAENGIFINNWRNETCEKRCKNNQILQYSQVSCLPTCFMSSSTEECVKQGILAEVCGCPEGQYLNNKDACVSKSECDCFLGYDVVPAHEKIVIDSYKCECFEGNIACVSDQDGDTDLCSGGAEFVDCSYPNTQRRIDLDCSTKNVPMISNYEDCKPGCYCPFGMVRDSKGNCIPSTDCPCIYGGDEYTSGSSVKISCNQCVCNKGTWECDSNECQTTCSIFGDGHVQTFDGMWYTFDGLCQYTLVKDISNDGAFQISAQSIPCCEDGLTCSRKILINSNGTSITLQDEKVRSDHSQSDRSSTDAYSVAKIGSYLLVTIQSGITLIWDKYTSIKVALPPEWSNKVAGICGNNNGDIKDDFTARNGMKMTRAIDMGNSWKDDPTCLDTETQLFPCDANPYCKAWALRKCQIIKDVTFKDCHSKVDPTPYYEACISEACVCDMEGKYLGFCTSVANYADACMAVGVCTNWRNADLCPVCCDYYNAKGENIWHYEPCGAANVKTCSNQDIMDKFSPLLGGCYPSCPSDAPYLDQNVMQCVQLSQCSCSYNNQIIAANSMVYDQNGKLCHCDNGNVICEEEPTPSISSEEPIPTTPVKYPGNIPGFPEVYYPETPEGYTPGFPEVYYPETPEGYIPGFPEVYYPETPEGYIPGFPEVYYPETPEVYYPETPEGYTPGFPEGYIPGFPDVYYPETPEGYTPGFPEGYIPGFPDVYYPETPEGYTPGFPEGNVGVTESGFFAETTEGYIPDFPEVSYPETPGGNSPGFPGGNVGVTDSVYYPETPEGFPEVYYPETPEGYIPGLPDVYYPETPEGYTPGFPEGYIPGFPDVYYPETPEGYTPGFPEGYIPGFPDVYYPETPEGYTPGFPEGNVGVTDSGFFPETTEGYIKDFPEGNVGVTDSVSYPETPGGNSPGFPGGNVGVTDSVSYPETPGGSSPGFPGGKTEFNLTLLL